EVVFNGILLDVTERAQAEATLRESQARYQQLFESSPVSLWEEDFSAVKAHLDRLLDAGVADVPAHLAAHPEVVRHCAGLVKIMNVNQATVDLLKAKDKQDLELHLPDLFTEMSYDVFRNELNTFLEGRTVFESEAVHMTLAGDLKPVECRMTIPPGYEQSFGRVLVSLQDITERKRAEETSRVHQEQLEALVALRTSELRSALEQAEAATRAKSVFLANMSHELRTPLNAVIGYAQLLTHSAQDPESRANLERILRASEHLLGLINDVLSLSRIEAGRLVLNPEPFETGPFLRDIENMTRLKAQAKRLAVRMELSPDLPAALHGDAQKLRQVLVNLLGNAVKFTQAGSVILRVTRDQELACFEILDTGVGIPAQDLDRLFKPFEQLGAPAGHAEGTGLGLHISQAMVQLMGGRIDVQSESGRGSTFRFTIRLPEASSAAVQQVRRRVVGLSGGQAVPSILVVDDVLDSRCLLRDLFSSMGLPVDTASSGGEAIARWEAARPDVVWMDLRMPGMNGWEATRRIRAREAELGGPRTTLIALTASAMDLDVEGLREAGFDDWVLKPIQ
ncbi:MAG TPA: ATP-binding protein, partial [Holophaga sp.]|nr:ATP-binding protein [Holophaga sp.]